MSDGTYRLTDTEWREYQNIPEQGYSHRAWIDHKIAERLQAVAAERTIRAERIWDSGYEAGKEDAFYRAFGHKPIPNPYRSVTE